MSPWERQIQYLAEQAQLENAALTAHTFVSANGSVYTAAVPPAGSHIHLHGITALNPGNATSVIHFYEAGNTAPTSIKAILAVPAASDVAQLQGQPGVPLGVDKALMVGMRGTQAGQVVEVLSIYHLDT